MQIRRFGLGLLAAWLMALSGASATSPDARELFDALNAIRVDRAQVYYVRDLHLRKDAVRLSFQEGKLALLEAPEGQVTGAVFTGTGRAIAVPRDAVERRSLVRFLGTPLLDLPFTRAYLRFTDGTAEQLLSQIRAAENRPVESAVAESFANDWNSTVANLNSWHSLRILLDRLSTAPQPYFYAGLAGANVGPFDMLVDNRREEQVLIGQTRISGDGHDHDIWASFPRADAPAKATIESPPVAYALSTAIHPDLTLEGKAQLRWQARHSGERVVQLELSRHLGIQSVTDAQGRPLEFFQNEALETPGIAARGASSSRAVPRRENNHLYVVLPEEPHEGAARELNIAYRGRVISDAGDKVYVVGERGSWYPSLIESDRFATFDLTFRWPRRLTLVATGKRGELHEEGEWRIGRWQTEAPVPRAGFHLGEYNTHTVSAGNFKVEIYANRQLEQAAQTRFQRQSKATAEKVGVTIWPRQPRRVPLVVNQPAPPPTTGALLNSLGEEVADSVHFYENYLGPFPFSTLAVSPYQSSETDARRSWDGHSWPGLLHISTVAAPSSGVSVTSGVSQQAQEQLHELLPFHDVAHQWWGNTIGRAGNRGEWIHEALASYLALLYAESRHADEPSSSRAHPQRENFLAVWLDRFRDDLVSPALPDPSAAERNQVRDNEPDQEERVSTTDRSGGLALDEAGPLMLGERLGSSKVPDAYARILYGKGAWIFHMLRMMMREPDAPASSRAVSQRENNPDERFQQLLSGLLESHRHRPLTTADLQSAVEKLMTPQMDLESNGSMEWFFDQWVRHTGIPRYSVTFEVTASSRAVSQRENPAAGQGFIVTGTLKQEDVPEIFTAAVPLYVARSAGKPVLLGTVITGGTETTFQFTTRLQPRRLLIDPERTLLCVSK